MDLHDTARPGFHLLPEVSREQNATDIEGFRMTVSQRLFPRRRHGDRNKLMAVFLLKLSINYTDEMEEGIYHCQETRESVDVGIRQRVAWAAIRGRRREIRIGRVSV